MGANQSKKKKKSKTPNNVFDENNQKSKDNDVLSEVPPPSLGKLQTQSTNISSSQANFFKMLDEKIENGIEFDEAEAEEERRRKLMQCVEEWDQVLGRSHEDTVDPGGIEVPFRERSSIDEEDEFSSTTLATKTTVETTNLDASVDSMKTMYSNSVGIPAGTFAEAENEVSVSPTDESSKKTIRPGSAAITGRRRITSPSQNVSDTDKSSLDQDQIEFLNRSLQLKTVLQDHEKEIRS